MRAFLCFLALACGIIADLQCPPAYNIIEGKCIRALDLEVPMVLSEELPNIRSECAKDGAHLPVVKNDADNEMFNRITNSFSEIANRSYVWLALDIACNTSTHRLHWIDGSVVSYSWKNTVDYNFDCVSSMQTASSLPNNDEWLLTPTDASQGTHGYTILCVTEGAEPTAKTPTTSESSPCGEYSLMDISTDEKPCIKIFPQPLSWVAAQNKCSADFGALLTINSAEENKYFWRTAISNGILEDMHIGAHQPSEDPSKWTWSDGEMPISNGHYNNFFGSFPIPGAGNCSAMLTESPSALWTNEDCTENPLPFICRRADFSNLTTTCPSESPKAGEDIFPPGFPDTSKPCEYLLFVAANKLVELQIMTLVAEEDRDFLEVFEGPAGPNLLANLTGSIFTTTTLKTTKSNVLRVNWLPFGTGSGRGFRIRYNEVDD